MKRSTIILILLLALAVSNAAWLALYQAKNMEIKALKANLTYYVQLSGQLAQKFKNMYDNYTALQVSYGRLKAAYDRLYSILKKGTLLLGIVFKHGKGTNATAGAPLNTTLEEATVSMLFKAYSELNQSLAKFVQLIQLHSHLGPQSRYLIDPDYVMPIVAEKIVGRLYDPKHPQYTSQDIKKIYEWITKNIYDVPDSDFPDVTIEYVNITGTLLPIKLDFTLRREYVQSAAETMKRRAGDCEDQAILATSMLIAYLQKLASAYTICLISSVQLAHCASMAVVDGKLYILDPTMGYYAVAKNPSEIPTTIRSWMDYTGYSPQYLAKVYLFNNTWFKSFIAIDDVIRYISNIANAQVQK
ncbi:MAG: hypothetical protein GXO09_05630 [Crenarchaeota archaeon]|nr:hypothetical protein [Thermoproteota archaeon]